MGKALSNMVPTTLRGGSTANYVAVLDLHLDVPLTIIHITGTC